MACVAIDSPCFLAGDDLYYAVEFKDSDGVAYDLTGSSAKIPVDKVIDPF